MEAHWELPAAERKCAKESAQRRWAIDTRLDGTAWNTQYTDKRIKEPPVVYTRHTVHTPREPSERIIGFGPVTRRPYRKKTALKGTFRRRFGELIDRRSCLSTKHPLPPITDVEGLLGPAAGEWRRRVDICNQFSVLPLHDAHRKEP